MKGDWIRLQGLRLKTFIGVPDEERAEEQEVRVHLRMRTACAFESMEDRIEETLDYAVLAEDLKRVAAERPRRLIETLAVDVAEKVLAYGAVAVEVEIEKFILPETDWVGVVLRRGDWS